MIHAVNDAVLQVATFQLLGQGVKHRFVLLVESRVEDANMVGEIGYVDGVIVRIIAAAHRIEQHVGKMTGILGFVAGGLYAVVVGNNSADVRRGGTQSIENELLVVRVGYLMEHGMHIAGVFLDVHHEEPSLALAGVEGQGFVQQVRALYALGFGFWVDLASVTEGVELHRAGEQLKVVGVNRIDGVARQALAGFGLIDHNSLHAVERKRRAGDLLDLLVAVHEGRIDVLRLAVDTGGKDVLQAIDDLELLRLRSDVLDVRLAHPTEAVGGLPDVTEEQTTGAIDFLKEDGVAGDGFADSALDLVQRIVVDAEGFPDHRPLALLAQRRKTASLKDRFAQRVNAHECTRTGERVVLCDLVVRIVREECEIRTAATASQTAR